MLRFVTSFTILGELFIVSNTVQPPLIDLGLTVDYIKPLTSKIVVHFTHLRFTTSLA